MSRVNADAAHVPDIRESILGAQIRLREFAEHASEAGPKWDETEARAQYPLASEYEATMSLAAAEESTEVAADAELAAACVGLRTDFDVDILPGASASSFSLPANVEDAWLAEVRMTVKLALARATRLALDGARLQLRRPSRFALRDSDRTSRLYTTKCTNISATHGNVWLK